MPETTDTAAAIDPPDPGGDDVSAALPDSPALATE